MNALVCLQNISMNHVTTTPKNYNKLSNSLVSDNKLFDLFIWSRAFCLNLATPDQHLR